MEEKIHLQRMAEKILSQEIGIPPNAQIFEQWMQANDARIRSGKMLGVEKIPAWVLDNLIPALKKIANPEKGFQLAELPPQAKLSLGYGKAMSLSLKGQEADKYYDSEEAMKESLKAKKEIDRKDDEQSKLSVKCQKDFNNLGEQFSALCRRAGVQQISSAVISAA